MVQPITTKPEKQTKNLIHELFVKRWSPRAFSDQPIDDKIIGSLLEAARWTASCFNEQPWHFTYAKKGTKGFDAILNALTSGNQVWAKNAPLLVLVSAKRTFDRNGKLNRHAAYDTGAAVWSFVTQATAWGLYTHQMAGFDVTSAAEVTELGFNYDPMVIIAVGHLGDPSDLPENLQGKEMNVQTRNDIKKFTKTLD